MRNEGQVQKSFLNKHTKRNEWYTSEAKNQHKECIV